MSSSGTSARTLTVVGGTYIERCQLPEWFEIYGSGLRAACALSERGTSIAFHTFVTDEQRPALESMSAALNFKLCASPTLGMYEFSYRHSLARPFLDLIGDDIDDPKALVPLNVQADSVLVFGMMEGNPIVNGSRVVYDPQSADKACHFNENGSRADHLALVLNAKEAARLSGETEIETCGKKLLVNAETVVIKNGPHGAFVFTNRGTTRVPAYRTTNTFLIGSGDIFSASFAHAWAVEGKDPVDAARDASLATAYYCQNTIVPLPVPLPVDFVPKEVTGKVGPKIYLAGPFFAPHEMWLVEEAWACLVKIGAKVFSPYHEVGLGPASKVAKADLAGLRECDGIFALLDGCDPGTVFEVGYARAIDKPVTAFTSSRDAVHLTMFTGSDCRVYHDFVSAIYSAVWS